VNISASFEVHDYDTVNAKNLSKLSRAAYEGQLDKLNSALKKGDVNSNDKEHRYERHHQMFFVANHLAMPQNCTPLCSCTRPHALRSATAREWRQASARHRWQSPNVSRTSCCETRNDLVV
jgi:hypothetical protein